MFASDAATFLADYGTLMSWTPSIGGAAISAQVLFDQADVGNDSGGHISREYTLTLEAAAWPGLKRAEQVVIGGATYRLRTDLAQTEDAVFSTVKLSRVSP